MSLADARRFNGWRISTDHQYRALIIEDEFLLASEMQSVLEELGFEVCDAVATENNAVEAAMRHRPELIAADVNLSEGNGMSAIERIREQLDACVIYVTADRKDVEAKVEGAVCVSKPFDAKRIARAIERALGHLPRIPKGRDGAC